MRSGFFQIATSNKGIAGMMDRRRLLHHRGLADEHPAEQGRDDEHRSDDEDGAAPGRPMARGCSLPEPSCQRRRCSLAPTPRRTMTVAPMAMALTFHFGFLINPSDMKTTKSNNPQFGISAYPGCGAPNVVRLT